MDETKEMKETEPKKRYELYHKVCRQCGEPLETTGKRIVLHPACRREYYLKSQRKQQLLGRVKPSVSNMSRARKRYFIMEPCEACGFRFLTRVREFLNKTTGQIKQHKLCPNCIAMCNCGLMEGLSWKLINEAAAPAAA